MIINWGKTPFKAFISVTYPKGTCTVSGKGQTYTHTGGGAATFTVKKKGTYTISAAQGSITKNATVNITKSGEIKTVTISFALYLFNGADVSTLTGGWSSSKSHHVDGDGYCTESTSVGSSLYVRADGYGNWANSSAKLSSKKSISFSGYNTLNFYVSSTGGQTRTIGYGSTTKTPTTGTNVFNISSANSSYVISLYAYSKDPNTTITVTKIWLDV